MTPAPSWTADDVPDQTGRIAIVTGGNSGIGLETVRALVKKGAKVYIAARREGAAHDFIESLKAAHKPGYGSADFIALDLASFRSIENFVMEFKRREQRLDLLFNNAGLIIPGGDKQVTKEGYEIHFGVNALGVHYLTTLLIPLLQSSGKMYPGRPARVCFTSSIGHHAAPKCGFDPADPSSANARFAILPGYMRAYANSKMANILSARKLNRMYSKDNIIINACNPGNLKTNISRDAKGVFNFLLKTIIEPYLLYSPELGSLSQLYANTSAEGEKEGGQYFVPWARKGRTAKSAEDIEVQDRGVFKSLTQPVSGMTIRSLSTLAPLSSRSPDPLD
ncbi:hypothetical protein MPSI1_000872 [Malassezia psittaci]|uniref:NAD(P)-binding protein n=1 Tax=Malassezia psittaci TaxID=1821823 RepID=A0AAF0F3G1_9BASI|nr:hypothetical protein MPSI1_000872 [Malassezia psittaci]